MREILFRGKKYDGKWYFGSYLYLNVPPRDWKGDARGKAEPVHYIVNEKDINYAVMPETVCQFTGKMDMNGKKVFENDILQLYTVWADGKKEKSVKVIVKWWDNDQCYVLTTKEGHHCDDFGNYGRPEYFEVIGNIYDNADLMA